MLRFPLAVALLAVAVSACSSSDAAAPAPDGKLRIVATTTQVADFARAVGGGRVQVTQILKANVDPHDYEPTPADVQAVTQADLVVKNGIGFERWLDGLITSAGFHGTVVDTSEGVKLRAGNAEEGEQQDPHIWHDPRNAKTMVGNLTRALAAKDPDDKAAYESAQQSYGTQLDTLDADIERRIGELPPDGRKLVTNHDAFGYFVDRYRLTFVGAIIPSFDTSAELSAKQLGGITRKIKETGVKAIFPESSLPAKTAQAISRETGVKVAGSLYSDTLGPEGSPGATYLGMLRHNADTIVTALR